VTSVKNWSTEWFLDWAGYFLKDPETYQHWIKEQLSVHISTAFKGQRAETMYQGFSKLGIEGDRDTAHRLDVMSWDAMDWTGLDVLDIGCNLGAFCFEAADRGARRVVGVDRAFLAWPMAHAANWLHYWNMDFIGVNLPAYRARVIERAGMAQFDVVLALSVVKHLGGYAPWIAEFVKPGGLLILETHGDEDPAPYEKALKQDFSGVELAGYTTDVKRRAVFLCQKGL